jgi:hypothetical protein
VWGRLDEASPVMCLIRVNFSHNHWSLVSGMEMMCAHVWSNMYASCLWIWIVG